MLAKALIHVGISLDSYDHDVMAKLVFSLVVLVQQMYNSVVDPPLGQT